MAQHAGMRRRGTAALTAVAALVGGMLLSVAPAGATTSAVTAISNPTTAYKDSTCVVKVGQVADGTSFQSYSACGVTFSFSDVVTKESVRAGGSWATWGSPPFTEGNKPGLIRNFDSQLTITLSSAKRTVGMEIEGQAFAVNDFTASFRSSTGTTVGVVRRSVDGNAGARLFALKSTSGTPAIKKIVITSTDLSGFALAKLRVG